MGGPSTDAIDVGHVTAANNSPVAPVSSEVVLSDHSIFLDNAHWFKLLQYDGKKMTSDEIALY